MTAVSRRKRTRHTFMIYDRNTAPVLALVTKCAYRRSHLLVVRGLNSGSAAIRERISSSLK
jgi:hypothetical protein